MPLTKEELNSLPAEISFHVYSDKAIEINLIIVKKYGLEDGRRFLLYQLLDKLFLKKILPADLPMACEKLFSLDRQTALRLACDIVGARLLIVKEWFAENLASLIIAWGGNPASYAPHISAQIKNKPIEEKFLAEQMSLISPDDEKTEEVIELKPLADRIQQIKDIFAQGLTKVLQYNDSELIVNMNTDVLEIVIKQGDEFENVLVSAMFNNKEQLTSERIVLDGRLLEPTVGNWLELFVRVKGAALFDMVTVMDFITNNDNTKKLGAEEKELLIKLFNVYRNLKFFPESQSSTNPNSWQIFSLPDEEFKYFEDEIENNIKPVQSAEKVGLVQDILEEKVLAVPAEIKEENLIQNKANNVYVNNNEVKKNGLTVPEALRLQNMLAEFPEGSIERLAIEEELKKYQ